MFVGIFRERSFCRRVGTCRSSTSSSPEPCGFHTAAGGKEIDLGTAEAGEVVGVLPVVDGRRQQVTVEALTETSIYAMDFGDLIDSAGGRALPVATVLQSLAQHLRWAVERVNQGEHAARRGRGHDAEMARGDAPGKGSG